MCPSRTRRHFDHHACVPGFVDILCRTERTRQHASRSLPSFRIAEDGIGAEVFLPRGCISFTHHIFSVDNEESRFARPRGEPFVERWVRRCARAPGVSHFDDDVHEFELLEKLSFGTRNMTRIPLNEWERVGGHANGFRRRFRCRRRCRRRHRCRFRCGDASKVRIELRLHISVIVMKWSAATAGIIIVPRFPLLMPRRRRRFGCGCG